jgi:hypothetical protein
MDAFFAQWITRPGAPELRLRSAGVEESGSGFRLRAVLEQTQDAPPYTLRVPVAVQVEGREQAILREVVMDGRERRLELDLPARPLRLAVDPAFDLFRRLHREEIPPAISQALGGEAVLMVLPSAAPEPVREAYVELVQSWQRGRDADVAIRRDDELEALPSDRVVWLLGWENRFRPVLNEALTGYDFESEADGVTLAGKALGRDEHAVAVLARHPGNPDRALAWVAADNVAAMPGLARKLPHYGQGTVAGDRITAIGGARGRPRPGARARAPRAACRAASRVLRRAHAGRCAPLGRPQSRRSGSGGSRSGGRGRVYRRAVPGDRARACR